MVGYGRKIMSVIAGNGIVYYQFTDLLRHWSLDSYLVDV